MGPRLQVIAGGKAEAADPLREMYERYGPAVRARCRYLLRDPAAADDALHEVFAKALEHLAGFRADASPLTWLVSIATHHCLNVLRSSRAGWRAELERSEKLKPAHQGGAGELELRDLVRSLLAGFDAETQAAAIHYWVDEMTLEETAGLLGRSVPTVRKRLAEFARAARAQAERLGAVPGAEESHG